MTTRHAIYRGTVTHSRTHQVRHAFRYPLAMCLFDVDALPALASTSRLAGYNCRRPIAVYDRDHFDGRPLAQAVRAAVAEAGGRWPGGRVLMLAQPRVFGYVFNPISVYYCLDADEAVDTVVAEVHNTYGERHVYVLTADTRVDEAGTSHRWDAKKVFHVSPFFDMEGTYRFGVSSPGEQLAFDVDLEVGGVRRLAARLRLASQPFTDGAVARMLARYPLMTVQVIAAIHWEALRLWWSGVPFRAKPTYAPDSARHTRP